MAIEITVPKLGWSMDEGTFVEWLKKNGDEVKPGDLLFALESDKAVQEIESLDSGILRIPENGPKKDDVVKVGQVLGYLTAPGEEVHEKANHQQEMGPSPDRIIMSDNAGGPAVPRTGIPADFCQPTGATERAGHLVNVTSRIISFVPAVSPRAARLAMEKGVDLSAVKGTGKNGRITEKDVCKHSDTRMSGVGVALRCDAPSGAAERAGRLCAAESGDAKYPAGLRKIIAERMLKSRSVTAPVTLTAQADASALVSLRNQFKSGSEGLSPTYNDMFIKIAAAALFKHPVMNSSWQNDRIVLNETINIGMAVDTEAGLLVPVVRDVPALTLRDLAAKTRDLGERARQRKLSAGELTGGTFTVSNLGTAGVDIFTPIINYPECAVLGIGRITRQAAVDEEGNIVAKHMVWLSLTFDHRIVDGAPAARFLNTIKEYIENPGRLT